MSDPFIGNIIPWVNTRIPYGWLPCQGQVLNIQQYTPLFAVIGANYGGDGQKTFALPDLRFRFIVGAGQDQTTGISYTAATKGGQTQVTLNASQLAPHAHSIAFANTSATLSGATVSNGQITNPQLANAFVQANPSLTPANTSNTPSTGQTFVKTAGPPTKIYGVPATSGAVAVGPVTGNVSGTVTGDVSGSVTLSGGTVAVGANTSKVQPIPTVPIYLAFNFIIAYEGIFPTWD